METLVCRACGSEELTSFIDLGQSPISNDLAEINQSSPDPTYSLHVRVCEQCAFVQLPELSRPEDLFRSDYVYFSSYSESWLSHCEQFSSEVIDKFNLTNEDLVIEVASNDGYLLQYFKRAGMSVLGVEPVAGVAKVAEEQRGIPTRVDFFGKDTAQTILAEYGRPKLMSANNVLAHVPNIHDFVEGFAVLLDIEGIATFEFPHIAQLIEHNQFDTIYHEHYSYLGLMSLIPVFQKHGLRVFDVQELSTHGGSLRLYVCREESSFEESNSIEEVLAKEAKLDPRIQEIAAAFREKALNVRNSLIAELSKLRAEGKTVAGYGAAAKGNTLLNYAAINSELIRYVVDRNPHKVGKALPGAHIPIVDESHFHAEHPDVVLILPWNIADEIVGQLDYLRKTGTKFVRAIPSLEYV